MPVSVKDAAYIAELARLKFSDAELEKITGDLNEILTYMDKLNELDTKDIEPLSHPVGFTNVFRDDQIKPSTSADEALKNAPDKTEEYFKVPKVISQS